MDKMFFEVRKATSSDVYEIQQLAKKSFKMYALNAGITELVVPLEESYEDVLKAVETTNVFVALSNEEVIGSVRIKVNDGDRESVV